MALVLQSLKFGGHSTEKDTRGHQGREESDAIDET